MKLNVKEIMKPALILFIICVVSALALGLTNMVTASKIEQAQIESAEQSRKIVLADADSFENSGEYYTGYSSGELIGYVFTTESKGYGGTVKVMTGINVDGEVKGVVVLSHAETPGLGANAEKADFTSQYQTAVPEGGFEVIKGAASSDNEISALTGATITSNAVTSAVNEALDIYNEVKGNS